MQKNAIQILRYLQHFKHRSLPVDVVRADVHVAREGDAARPRLGHVQRVPVPKVLPLLLLTAGVAPAARTPGDKGVMY